MLDSMPEQQPVLDPAMMEPEPIEPEPIVLDRTQMLKDLHTWAIGFVKRSAEWRQASYEKDWEKWQRAANQTYEPSIAAKKQSWQSMAVDPITASHKQNAQAQLFKTEVGPQPPLDFKAREGIVLEGMVDQSTNIRDLILREREKSRYPVERNKVVDDKTTYGSGFARMRFETKIEDRKVKVPQYEPVSVFDPTSVVRAMTGQRRIVGYVDEIQPQVVYRGTVFEHISIWDVFPDPKALKIKGNPIAYRYETTYGDILAGAEEGYYIPECIPLLKGHASEENTPSDKQTVQNDKNIAEAQIERPDYGRRFQCFEVFARLPKKWVFINGEPIDDPEKLIPAKVRVHPASVIGVEVNDNYDGEPDIYKDDYLPVAGEFYGMGIPKMLKDVQLVCSESVNQRLDAGSLALKQRLAVIEKALVDPKDLEEDRNVIRIKNPSGMNDIRQAIMLLDMGNVPNFAFIESQEWERKGQEMTSVTRQTMGTAGQVKDANQTLGGMELIRAATGDKFAYLGMLSEFDFQYEIARAYWRLIYSNYTPEDVVRAIGLERAQTFIFLTPEQVENDYSFVPMGIYTMENKAMRQARLAQWNQQFGVFPWANVVENAKAQLQSMDEDPKRFVLPEADAMQITLKAEQMAAGMAEQVIAEEQAKEANGQPGKA